MSQANLNQCTDCTRPNDNKNFTCPERMSDLTREFFFISSLNTFKELL